LSAAEAAEAAAEAAAVLAQFTTVIFLLVLAHILLL
jgi:hypothetical protein